MPFADDQKKTEHFVKHGLEICTKSNEVFAAVMRILLQGGTDVVLDWNADNYEKVGDWIVENGTPFQGAREGKFVYVSDDVNDGVIIAGYRKKPGLTILTTVFYADNIESKFVKTYIGEE
jgi:hypothetical protein